MKQKQLNIEVNASIKRLELGLKNLVRTRRAGFYPSLFKGKGLEFDGFTQYNYGDDASLIDWKASMRTGDLLCKRFREERDLKILFVVDVSSKMLFGSSEKLKCEYVAELAAALAYVILRGGDRVGFVFFSDKIKKYVMPRSGLVSFHRFLSELKDPELYGGKSNLKRVLRDLGLFLSRDHIPIIISDFLGPINWSKQMRVLSEKVETIAFKVQDPRDFQLPSGVKEVVISDPNTGKTLLVDVDLVKAKYERYAAKHREVINKIFRASGIDCLEISTDKHFVNKVVAFFERRKGWK